MEFFFVSPWQDSCQEWCRYPAGALTSVRSGAEIGPLSLRLSVSQGASLGDFLLAPACPIEKVTPWVDFLYLTLWSESDEDIAKELNPGLRVQTPVRYPLGCRITPAWDNKCEKLSWRSQDTPRTHWAKHWAFKMQQLSIIPRLGYVIMRYTRYRCFQHWPGLSNTLFTELMSLTLSSLHGPRYKKDFWLYLSYPCKIFNSHHTTKAQ